MPHRFHPIVALVVVALASAVSSGSQDTDWDAVEIKAQQVAPGVHMLVGEGGNIGVSSGQEGVLIVDDQYAPLTEKILAAIKKISSDPVRFVVNTHWHSDHTGGNENMGKTGSVIVAHENVRRRMSSEQFNAFRNSTTPAAPKGALPVVTFLEDVSFHMNGDELHVFHVDPAHTDGDSVIHWKQANVIHMGDLFFAGQYPFIDLASGGSADGIIAAAEKVLAMADSNSKIIPGHGPLSTKQDLAEYIDVLKAIRSRVQTQIDAGKSLEEVKAAGITKEWDAEWGGGFINGEQIVEFMYRSLSR